MGPIKQFVKQARQFLTALRRNKAAKIDRHAGHNLADNVRDAVGPVGGGSEGGNIRTVTNAVLDQATKGPQR